MQFLQTITLLVVGVGVTLLADVFLKKSELSTVSLLSIGAFLYALVAIPVAAAFKFNQFSIVILLWQAVIVSIGLLLGWLIFKEPLTPLKIAAFGAALLTVLLSYLASR